jgi:glycolate oxidase
MGMSDLVDVVVPRSRIADFVEEVKKISARVATPIITFGHAGDGNVHLQPVGESVKDEKQRKIILTEIYKAGISMGGTLSGEHGLGAAKKGYLPLAADPAQIELMRRIKRAFDPNHIMNPGKVLDF